MSKKEELYNKIVALKESKPELEDINWSEIIRKNPDVLENIVSGVVRVEGQRRKIDRRDGHRRLDLIYDNDHSELPFEKSFTNLLKDETLRKAAKRIGISAAHVYNLKEGKVSPTLEVMEQIAEAYGRKPSYFLEYRIYYVLLSMNDFLLKNPETASAWFSKTTSVMVVQ